MPFLQGAPLPGPMPDGGAVYWETDFTRVIREPWNAASSALFILLSIYWMWRIWGHWGRYRLLSVAIPVLAIGSIGGTLYHAFRSRALWLYMDWVPIALLLLCTAIYLWIQHMPRWWQGLLMALPFLLLMIVLGRLIYTLPYRRLLLINLNYVLMVLFLLVPLLLELRRTRWQSWWLIAWGLGLFLLAISARALDRQGLLPMGTHFLWHTFGALATHQVLRWLRRYADLRQGEFAQARIA